MTAQEIMEAARLTRVRELQTQLARAAAENTRLAAENAELKAHFDLALLAVEDLRSLPEGGKLVLVDGWNIILGARRGSTVKLDFSAREPKDLVEQAKAYLATHPLDFVWIVFDGPHENSRMTAVGGTRPNLRVSYTGGAGAHRADKFICDFLRMAKFRGTLDRIVVETRDKDFLREVKRLASCVLLPLASLVSCLTPS